MLRLTDENLSLSNGDWVTLQSQTNETFTLQFTHSQTDSTIRWTDALNTNPFGSQLLNLVMSFQSRSKNQSISFTSNQQM